MKNTEEQGKLTETYSLRIPHKLKIAMDEYMSLDTKHKLNNELRLLIAESCHTAKNKLTFNPTEYLGEE